MNFKIIVSFILLIILTYNTFCTEFKIKHTETVYPDIFETLHLKDSSSSIFNFFNKVSLYTIYSTYDESRSDTVFQATLYKSKQYVNYKDRQCKCFKLFNIDSIRRELILKLKKKEKKVANTIPLSYKIDLENLAIGGFYFNFEDERMGDSILEIENDSLGNKINIEYYSHKDKVNYNIKYQYFYKENSAVSYEFQKNLKYLRSVLILDNKNKIVKENFFMANSIIIEAMSKQNKKLPELLLNPYMTYFFEYDENNLLRTIKVVTDSKYIIKYYFTYE